MDIVVYVMLYVIGMIVGYVVCGLMRRNSVDSEVERLKEKCDVLLAQNRRMRDKIEGLIERTHELEIVRNKLIIRLKKQIEHTRKARERRDEAILNPKITGETSDGYHTFNELYHHRAVLFSVICNTYEHMAWKSLKHSDGTMFDGMFIIGINTPDGQATYHYDVVPYWDMFKVRELENAPEWDGHTPAQAIERIGNMSRQILTHPCASCKYKECGPFTPPCMDCENASLYERCGPEVQADVREEV